MRHEILDFCTLKIGDRIIIGEMEEGVDIQLREFKRIIEVARENFKDSRWGYISNRVNVYSLQPRIHHEASNFERNMVAFAAVTKQDLHIRNALLEKRIVGDRYRFQCFSDIEFALKWVREEVERANRLPK